MIKVLLVKRADNPAEDREFRGWFETRFVKKHIAEWLETYDQVELSKPKIGVLVETAPWAEEVDVHVG